MAALFNETYRGNFILNAELVYTKGLYIVIVKKEKKLKCFPLC